MKPINMCAVEQENRNKKWVNRFDWKFRRTFVLPVPRTTQKKKNAVAHFFSFALCNVLLSGDYKKMPILLLFSFASLLIVLKKRKQWDSCRSLEFHSNSKLYSSRYLNDFIFGERKEK